MESFWRAFRELSESLWRAFGELSKSYRDNDKLSVSLLSRKFANMRCTKALRDFCGCQKPAKPTPGRLRAAKAAKIVDIFKSKYRKLEKVKRKFHNFGNRNMNILKEKHGNIDSK